MLHIRPLLVSLASLPLLAADLQISDVRLEVGRGDLVSYDAEYRYTEGPGSAMSSGTYTSDSYDGEEPVFISALYSRANLAPFGFVWAAGIEYQNSSDEIDGERFDTDLIGAKARAGLGWTPAPFWRVEATAEGHIGWMRVEDADIGALSSLDRSTADGAYSALGLQIGAGYAFKGKWDVGVSLRAIRYDATTDAEFSATGGSYEADLSWVLLSVAVTGGYRF